MRLLRNAILVATVLVSQKLLAESGWHSLGNLVSVDERASEVELTTQRGKVRIRALAPGVIRVTYAPSGSFQPDQSFAVLPEAFPTKINLRISKSDAGIEL